MGCPPPHIHTHTASMSSRGRTLLLSDLCRLALYIDAVIPHSFRYAVSAGNIPEMFPEHVARWLAPTNSLHGCCTKEAIEREEGWLADNHIKATLLHPSSDGELEICSTEQQAYVFDGE